MQPVSSWQVDRIRFMAGQSHAFPELCFEDVCANSHDCQQLVSFCLQPNGAYVKGLFMEGARWCRKTRVITESQPKILYDLMPIVSFPPLRQALVEIVSVRVLYYIVIGTP